MTESKSNLKVGNVNSLGLSSSAFAQGSLLSANATETLIDNKINSAVGGDYQKIQNIVQNAVVNTQIDIEDQCLNLLNSDNETVTTIGAASTNNPGLMSSEDKKELNNISSTIDIHNNDIQHLYATNIDNIQIDNNNQRIDLCSTRGEQTSIPAATTQSIGLMTAKDKTKLNNLKTVATSGSYSDLNNKPDLTQYYTKQSTIKIQTNGIYYTKGDDDYPVAHPDLSTTAAILPQRYNGYKIAEALIAPGQESTIPSNALILQAFSFNDSACVPANCKKTNNTWSITNTQDVTPTYTVVQYAIGANTGINLDILKINTIQPSNHQYCFINRYDVKPQQDIFTMCEVILNQSIVGTPTVSITMPGGTVYNPSASAISISSKNVINDTITFAIPVSYFTHPGDCISAIRIDANSDYSLYTFEQPRQINITEVNNTTPGSNDFVLGSNPIRITFDEVNTGVCDVSDYAIEVLFYSGAVVQTNSVTPSKGYGDQTIWEAIVPTDITDLATDKVMAIKCYVQYDGIMLAEFGRTN